MSMVILLITDIIEPTSKERRDTLVFHEFLGGKLKQTRNSLFYSSLDLG